MADFSYCLFCSNVAWFEACFPLLLLAQTVCVVMSHDCSTRSACVQCSACNLFAKAMCNVRWGWMLVHLVTHNENNLSKCDSSVLHVYIGQTPHTATVYWSHCSPQHAQIPHHWNSHLAVSVPPPRIHHVSVFPTFDLWSLVRFGPCLGWIKPIFLVPTPCVIFQNLGLQLGFTNEVQWSWLYLQNE